MFAMLRQTAFKGTGRRAAELAEDLAAAGALAVILFGALTLF